MTILKAFKSIFIFMQKRTETELFLICVQFTEVFFS